MIGFEPAESARWCAEVRPDGVAVVNTMRLVPPIVSIGLFEYPTDPIQTIRDTGVRVIALDAGALAKEVGDLRLGNTVMLGAAAAYLPLEPGVLENVLMDRFRTRKPALAEANQAAFTAGRQASATAADQSSAISESATASA